MSFAKSRPMMMALDYYEWPPAGDFVLRAMTSRIFTAASASACSRSRSIRPRWKEPAAQQPPTRAPHQRPRRRLG